MDVVVAGKTGKDLRENCGTERLRSRVNRNKNRYAIVPFPCEQSIFAFQKLERRWNGTIAFPCERGLRTSSIIRSSKENSNVPSKVTSSVASLRRSLRASPRFEKSNFELIANQTQQTGTWVDLIKKVLI